MDPQEYVAARYGRLLEYAVELGAPEGQAAEYVDDVLVTQRRMIRRLEDPDPMVREALARAVLRQPEPRRSPWPWVGVALGGLAVTIVWSLLRTPETDPMPSLFAQTGESAQALLSDAGYDVVLRPFRECEPMGQVLGSDPPAGDPVERGGRVEVFTAVPSGADCEGRYDLRREAWEFLRYLVDGGADPPLAARVSVVVDGEQGAAPLPGQELRDSPGLVRLRGLLADLTSRPAEGPPTQPRLTVSRGLPPETTCGVPTPPVAVGIPTLRLQVDRREMSETDFGCPLTIDLVRRDRGEIVAIAAYGPQDPP